MSATSVTMVSSTGMKGTANDTIPSKHSQCFAYDSMYTGAVWALEAEIVATLSTQPTRVEALTRARHPSNGSTDWQHSRPSTCE
jgi:hypothetical protein